MTPLMKLRRETALGTSSSGSSRTLDFAFSVILGHLLPREYAVESCAKKRHAKFHILAVRFAEIMSRFGNLRIVPHQRTDPATQRRHTGNQVSLMEAIPTSTGLRIEEAVGLRVEDLRGAVLLVGHSHWNGEPYDPKTDAGTREEDIHYSLVSQLRERMGTRTTGSAFQSPRRTACEPQRPAEEPTQNAAGNGAQKEWVSRVPSRPHRSLEEQTYVGGPARIWVGQRNTRHYDATSWMRSGGM